MRSLLSALILLALPGSALAQAETVRLDAAEAVERALAVSPRLRELQANEKAAEAAVAEAGSARKPQVDVSAGYTRYSDVPELTIPGPVGGEAVLFPNLPNYYRARVGASLPLYTSGRIPGLVDAARGERSSAREATEASRRDLALETRQAYWRLVTSRERERVLGESLAAFEAHLSDARNRERFGLAAGNEVLAVSVERDRAELERMRAETAARLAEADLRRLLGLAPGTAIETAEGLERIAADGEDVEALVAEAQSSRSELAALEARAQAAEARARVAGAATKPQVQVSASYLVANPNPRFLPPREEWNDNWELGVNVGLELFDGGQASASRARALAQAEAIRAQVDDLSERIRLQVLSAALEVQNASEAVGVSEQAVASARESRRVASERYREGVILSSELLDAEVALLRAELDLTSALASQRLSRAALDRAVGR